MKLGEHCNGCTISQTDRGFYCIQEPLEQSDVLFISDSITAWSDPFTPEELELIEKFCEVPFETAASVKCPDVKDGDLTANDRNLCRNYLHKSIETVSPKLIMTCGNLATVMLLKKSGITTKRGNAYPFGDAIVVPTFHPTAVLTEPRLLYLFALDIRNAIDKYIHGISEPLLNNFKLITKESQFEEYKFLFDCNYDIACDTETTGLDPFIDTVSTVAFSFRRSNEIESIVLPMEHFESPFKDNLEPCVEFCKNILHNEKNRKIFHNAKFDLKMLYRYGIKPVKVWDTMLMSHMENENKPHSLLHLLKEYYPEYLEHL